MEFRNIIADSAKMALGCSHTLGVGVEANETWSFLLGAKNFGVNGASADLVVRVLPDLLTEHKPAVVYILWPDWTRFEYLDPNGVYVQSLPTDQDRLQFMAEWTDEKLQTHFQSMVSTAAEICKQHNVTLVDLTLYDLIPYIDHADRWPISKLGHHYSPIWHQWVADIFAQKEKEQYDIR